MRSNYLKPGIAAIVLAVLFPLYWSFILIVGPAYEDLSQAIRLELMTFDWMDGLFILIGILEVYVYLSLIRSFDERLNSSLARAVLFIMIGAVVFFHCIVFVDLYLTVFQNQLAEKTIESVIEVSVFIALSGLVIYIISGFILSVVLLARSQDLPKELKYFAVIFLLVCLLGATILFSVINLLLFPVALIVLAIYFFKDPETLEVV
ncbi:MAG: hypothetical protein OQJ89_03930 [Kangiellaceae bacterium]|nr:hypothetical protein [Kangiellaceae bacterium]MCW8997558.1 hypothetical protein [Kangiellaceae bacterium]MCW9016089.1 hypothetical protein [Kangiellaceae bacterium]